MDTTPAARLPEHETTYRRLREMVLFGVLAPGQKVTIQGIARALDAGMTPVREAIRRLTAEGALELHENRRVSVPRLRPAQLDELAFARRMLEPKLARMALNGWGAGHRRAGRDRPAARRRHRGGRRARLPGLQLPLPLRALRGRRGADPAVADTQSLWLRFGPSLRVVIESGGTIGPDRHRDALAALRAGDADALAAAIEADVVQGLERVRDEIGSGIDAARRGGAK
jgi:DNA-binding GntR family transcriptional regulator